MRKENLIFHDNDWQRRYSEEVELIKENQTDNFVEIHHIGSTAIQNIYAKPKIDMALVVRDLEESKKLQSIGYEFKGSLNIPFRYFFSKKTKKIFAHIHVMMPKDPELEGFLLFRDYMNTHEEARRSYSELKLKIKDLLDSAGNEHFLNEYTLAKNDFITSILKKAGFKGLCMRLVSHYAEKDYEKKIYKNFKEDDIRVIFYKGSEIIGYANADKSTRKINVFEVNENAEYFKDRFERYLETLK